MVRVSAIVLVVCLSAASATASTMRDLLLAAEAAQPVLAKIDATAANELSAAIAALREADVLDESIEVFVGQMKAPGAAVRAHRGPKGIDQHLGAAIATIKRVANTQLAEADALPDPLRIAVVELQTAEQTAGLEVERTLLARFARKYGPGSAKLNGIEVLAAYALQRMPAFGVNAKGEAGPLEPILAYAPSYFSRSGRKNRVIGVAEVGLRHYFFGERWGRQKGRLAWLKPAYASYGVALSGNSDAPMTPPWQGATRVGAFFGWGALKVAYVGGEGKRLLVTQQLQFLPWVF